MLGCWRQALTALAAGMIVVGPAVAVRAQQPSGAEAMVAEARTLFDALDYERAALVLDGAIARLQPRARQDPDLRAALSTAYELRARVRFGLGDTDGARDDFRRLLTLASGYIMPSEVSPRIVELFDAIREEVVGEILLTLTPPDAVLEIDGLPYGPVIGPIPLPAGDHRLDARRLGYRAGSLSFSVTAGSTGVLLLELERVSATLALVSSPPSVEIFVDGALRGTTSPGPITEEYAEWPSRLGVAANALSTPLLLEDLQPGPHLIEFRRDCYTRVEQRFDITEPTDYRLDPVQLAPAVAAVRVASSSEGATVFVDDQPRGAVPLAVDDICEGPHTLEVRSPYGRFVHRFEASTGDQLDLDAELRPVFAVLSTSGLPEGLRGGPDLRQAIERALADAGRIVLYAPDAAAAESALSAEQLSQGWLAFDLAGQSMDDVASNITATARRDLSTRLSRVLDVQGVAEVTVLPDRETNEVLLSLLASGSGEPNVLAVRLDRPDSIADAVAQLTVAVELFKPSVGLVVVDVLDVPGPVVVSVEADVSAAAAGFAPGDVITTVGGQEVANAMDFAARLGAREPGDSLVVEGLDVSGAQTRAELTIAAVPRVVAMGDQSRLFNKLILDFRYRLAEPASELEESVVRLNLAVSLMAVGSWGAARSELERVALPDGPGVSAGTVQYLLGLCYEADGRFSEAQAAWLGAAEATGSLLTENGPEVRGLAQRKLDEARVRAR